MKKVAIFNYKGGVGKTISSINIGYNLSLNHRVLLLDADPQGNLSSFFSMYDTERMSLADVLMDKGSAKQAIRKTKYKNLSILPADIHLEHVGEINHDVLKKKFSEISGQYDYIIMDCPPSMQMNTYNVLVAADEVITPVKVDKFGIDGLDQVLDQIDAIQNLFNPDIKFLGFFVNMYAATKAIKTGIGILLEKYDAPVFSTVIRKNTKVDYSTLRGKPLLKCASTSNVAQDFMDLTEEYLRKAGD